MKIKEYAEQIVEKLGEGAKVEQVKKNNVVLTGIEYGSNGNIAPVFYVDGLHKNGVSVDKAVEIIKEQAKDGTIDEVKDHVANLSDFESNKSLLRIRLYNTTLDADVSLSGAEWGFDDLIIVPYIQINEMMSARVTKAMLEYWGVTQEEVFDIAFKNIRAEACMRSMADEINEMAEELGVDMDGFEEAPRHYIVSNKNGMYGASCILFERDTLKELYPNGYVVLPSSIHEVIVVEKNFSQSAYDAMVREANEQSVEPEERLSDHAYLF